MATVTVPVPMPVAQKQTPPEVANAPMGSFLAPERIGVWAWVLGYTAILTSLSVLRAQLWLGTGFDFGLYQQGLWQILHQGLQAATTYTGQPILAQGAPWVLILLAPLYALGGPGLLLALQSFALGLGYLLIRRMARTLEVPAGTAHLLGVIYLLFPTVLGSNLFDFHPTVLAVPLFFGLVITALERRTAAFMALAVLCFLVQASVAVPLAGIGVALVLQRRVLWGLGTIGAALLGLWLDLRVLLPLAVHAHLAWGPTLIPSGPAGGPATLLHSLLHMRSWQYLAWLAAPLALVSLAGRPSRHIAWLIPALAVITTNLLSPALATTNPFTNDSLLAVPFLMATVVGQWIVRPVGSRRQIGALLAVPLIAVVAFFVHDWQVSWRTLPPNGNALSAAAALIPPGASVVAQNFSAAQLSARPAIWLPSSAVQRSLPSGTYVLLDGRTSTGFTPVSTLQALNSTLAGDRTARHVYAKDDVYLYELTEALPALKGH